MRRLALDADTVALLTGHRARALGVKPPVDAFLFSHKPLHDTPADPSGVTHRHR